MESLTMTGDERLEALQYLYFAIKGLNLAGKLADPDALQASFALEYLNNIGRMIGGQAKWELLLIEADCAEMTDGTPHGDTPVCANHTKSAIDARAKAILARTKPDAEALERLTARAKAVSDVD